VARTERLLDLLQQLRTYRFAVPAQTLAQELGVSLRTIYRDIESLKLQGAPIEGEAGVGYVLKPGFTLPPLMFSIEELEALILGVRWVGSRADTGLAKAARSLISKVRAVVPNALRREWDATTLMVGPPAARSRLEDGLATALRHCVRSETKLTIVYRDEAGRETERTVWPFGLGFFDNALMLLAWCELRNDLRNFVASRIQTWTVTQRPYPDSRSALLERWRIARGLDPADLGLN